jgi:hypothetical protein
LLFLCRHVKLAIFTNLRGVVRRKFFLSTILAFLADAILMQRYVDLSGQFKRVIPMVKVRASAHSKDIRFFDIEHDNSRTRDFVRESFCLVSAAIRRSRVCCHSTENLYAGSANSAPAAV